MILELVSEEEAKDWKRRQCLIGSHPRSGSHWLRRMLGEVAARRTGFDLTFVNIDTFIGFNPIPVNDDQVSKHTLPLFYATHNPDPRMRVFLRRKFSDVLNSCWKAEDDSMNLNFTGSKEEIFDAWNRQTTFGTKHAELVVDYDMMKYEPKAVVSAIFKHCQAEVSDTELDQAVAAGLRANMLKEQERSPNKEWSIINDANY